MSTLNVSNVTDGTTTVGTSYVVNGSAKAWGFFNGTGTIVLFGSGFNTSSLTDVGTGIYQLHFTNNMADANYTSSLVGNTFHTADEGHNTAYAGVSTYSVTHGSADTNRVNVAVHGDLA